MKNLNEIIEAQPTPTNLKELRAFFKAIPAKFWCVGQRDDYKGHHCALGLMDKKRTLLYSYRPLVDPIKLAAANNGTGSYRNMSIEECKTDTKAKTRTIAFLTKLIKAEAAK